MEKVAIRRKDILAHLIFGHLAPPDSIKSSMLIFLKVISFGDGVPNALIEDIL